jgi:hypothetical protein
VQDGRAGSLERGFSDADIEEVYRAEKDGTLPDNVGQAVKGLRAAKLFPPAHCIVQIEVLRGPSYHWWADAVFSMVAVGGSGPSLGCILCGVLDRARIRQNVRQVRALSSPP